MRTVFFHEDDYCQVEVVPTAAADGCRTEMGIIDNFAETHRDGVGFTDIYIRGESPVPLSGLAIKIEELRAAVESLLTPFDQVFTGYSTYRELCQSTVGWGDSGSEAMFASSGGDGIVTAVWLSIHGILPEQVVHWSRVLRALPHSMELAISDWNSGEVVPISDEPKLTAYLRRYHAEQNTAADRDPHSS